MSDLKELENWCETRLKILGETDNADEAVNAIHHAISSHNPPYLSIAQYQALGMALAFSEVRHVIKRMRDDEGVAPNTLKEQ